MDITNVSALAICPIEVKAYLTHLIRLETDLFSSGSQILQYLASGVAHLPVSPTQSNRPFAQENKGNGDKLPS